MSIEETLDRLATNVALLTGAVATLAESVNGTYKGKPIYAGDAAPTPAAPPAETPAPQKRGRGRPVKGEETAAPVTANGLAPVVVQGVHVEADPFAAPAKPATPTVTIEQVREALTALKGAASQEIAVAVLKQSGGADNLTALPTSHYAAVVFAAAQKQAEYTKAPAPAAADPFAVPAATAAAPNLTIEDVKKAVVAAQKTTATDTVQKVVMAHGGQAPNPEGGAMMPSLKALPPKQFAATIAAIQALPATK